MLFFILIPSFLLFMHVFRTTRQYGSFHNEIEWSISNHQPDNNDAQILEFEDGIHIHAPKLRLIYAKRHATLTNHLNAPSSMNRLFSHIPQPRFYTTPHISSHLLRHNIHIPLPLSLRPNRPPLPLLRRSQQIIQPPCPALTRCRPRRRSRSRSSGPRHRKPRGRGRGWRLAAWCVGRCTRARSIRGGWK